MRGIVRTVALSAWIVAIPSAASAQSATAGTVKDSGETPIADVQSAKRQLSSVILTYNTPSVLGGPWCQPHSVLTAGLPRISAEF